MITNSIFTALFFCCICNGELIDSFGEITDSARHLQMKRRLLAIAENVRKNQDIFQDFNLDYMSYYYRFPQEYVDNKYASYTEGLPIMIKVLESKIPRHRFGNLFGLLLNDYACAHALGAHMIVIIQSSSETHYEVRSFEKYIPTIIVHQNPIDYNKSKTLIQKCGPYPFPWEYDDAVILRQDIISNIRKIINYAVTNTALEHYHNQTIMKKHPHDHLHSNNTIQINHRYPTVGDVAIHYRCSDNMRNLVMGLLPFPTIISLIPSTAKYIYLHTEGTNEDHPCYEVIKTLFEDILKAFPTAYVIVLAKNPIFETMYDFMNCRMTLICSASTFCLHAAIGRIKGDIYFPRKMYGGNSTYNYPSWYYIEQLSRTEWPDGIFDDPSRKSEFVAILRNITLFNSNITPTKM